MTIYDLAKLAGVSPRTVTRAFRNDPLISAKTRERILRIAAEHDYRPNDVARRIRGDLIRILAVSVGAVEVFTSDILKGFENAKNALRNYKTEVRILSFPDMQSFADSSAELLANGVNGIAVAALDRLPPDLSAFLLERGIPVMTVLAGDEASPYDGFPLGDVSVDTEMKGRMAGNLLALLKPGGRFGIFTGSLDTAHHRASLRGFREETEKRGATSVAIWDTKDDPDRAAELARLCIRDPDPCDGIFFASANSVAPIEVFRAEGYQPAIVASDIFPKMSDWLRDGTVQAVVFQNPEKQSRIAVMNLYAWLAEGRLPEKRTKISPQLVLGSNLSVYEKDDLVSI